MTTTIVTTTRITNSYPTERFVGIFIYIASDFIIYIKWRSSVDFIILLSTIFGFYYPSERAKEILSASHDEPRTVISKLLRTSEAEISAVRNRISTYGIVSESHRQ